MPKAESSGAKWIWMAGKYREVNCHLVFRKVLRLAGAPAAGRLRIAASDQYRLFVNGRRVGDGPARSEIPTAYADSYDAADLGLRKGANCIAVLAHSTMLPQHGQSLTPGGLWLEMECTDSAGRTVRLKSDASWRVAEPAEFVKPAPRRFFAVGFNERVDFSLAARWAQPGLDDSKWARAVRVNDKSFHRLVERPIPMLRFEEWRPRRIRSCGTVAELPGVSGLPFDRCEGLPHGQAVFGTHIWCDRAREARFSVGCDNWMRLWVNGANVWEQGRPDSGFTKHLEYEVEKYDGMMRGNGHRYEPGSSRLSQGKYPQIVRLRRGWNEVKLWIWRPETAYGFDLCFQHPDTDAVISTVASADKDKTQINAWNVLPAEESAIESGRAVTVCGAEKMRGQDARGTRGRDPYGQAALAAADLRPLLEASHLWDWDARTVAERPHAGAHSVLEVPQGKSPLVLPPGGYVEYELGRDGVGFLDVELSGPRGTVVDVILSEAERIGGRVRALYNGLWQVDRLTLSGGRDRWLSLDRRAGRYLGMVVRRGGPVKVKRFSLCSQHYPVSRPGTFECSDWVLTRMWSAGAATVDAATFDVAEDCPTREKAQWSGDTYLRLFECAYLWGDVRLSAKGIREFAEDQKADRWARPMVPCGYGDKLVEYCFQLPNWVLDHYQFSGDLDVVRDSFGGVKDLFTYIEKLADRRGFAQGGDDPRNIIYLDYSMPPTKRCGDTIGGLQCFYVLALEAAAELAKLLREDALAAKWAERAAHVRDVTRRAFWVEKKGLFGDGLRNGRPGGTFSAVTNYWMLRARVPSARQEEAMLKRLWAAPNRENMKLWERGESPLTKFYVSWALLERGLWKKALAVYRGYYGTMLRHPEALSVFEMWRREWIKLPIHPRNSLVHPFGIGPMAHLMMYFAGVRPLRPGFEGVLWEPMPADLEWMRAEMPLVGRPDTVRVEMETLRGGGRRLVLSRPAGLEVRMSDRYLAPGDRMEVTD